jgi:phosphoadenosine phosphosulfate reductase
VVPGDDPRSGRWWWERPESRECGIHFVDGKAVRASASAERVSATAGLDAGSAPRPPRLVETKKA